MLPCFLSIALGKKQIMQTSMQIAVFEKSHH
jgi:hypothetical protein